MTNSYYLKHKELKKKFLKIGRNCKISNFITFLGEKNLSIGNNVSIDDFCIINRHYVYTNFNVCILIPPLYYLYNYKDIKIDKRAFYRNIPFNTN